MWRWLQEQLDIGEELALLPNWYMLMSGGVLFLAIVGLYFHYTAEDNRLLAAAIVTTLSMAVCERYLFQVRKSANLTIASAIIYTLLML